MANMRLATALAMAFTFLLAAVPALAEHHEAEAKAEGETSSRKPWNQQAMTDLSSQLAESMSALRKTFRKEPAFRSQEAPGRRAAHQMEQTLRKLETSTRQLRSRVAGGAGFEETQGIARRIGMLLNDADVEGRKIMTSAWMAESVQPAMKLINEIAPYYGRGPLYDPETMQRLDRPPNPESKPAPK